MSYGPSGRFAPRKDVQSLLPAEQLWLLHQDLLHGVVGLQVPHTDCSPPPYAQLSPSPRLETSSGKSQPFQSNKLSKNKKIRY